MSSGDEPRVRGLRAGDPRELGAYRIVGRLGEGGMGSVYLADSPDGRPVALKVIRGELAHNPEFRRRFRSEVARARQVPPFCTAEVLDADTDHDPPYLVVEYVDGPSLAAVVEERGPLTPANQHGLAVGVAVALTAIHGAGVIHRDLKPGNVLLAPGSPKVIDFGIARGDTGTDAVTKTDQVVGTIAYMAPERFGPNASSAITPAADIFAWGAIVAYAATGRTPFGADLPAAMAVRILTQPPDLEGLSGQLRDLVERALAKDPAQRPTARELVDHLLAGGARETTRPAAEADPSALLTTWKGQWQIEHRRRDAKGPLRIRPLFVTSNRRIVGLVTILGIALMIFSLLEREARRTLGAAEKVANLLAGHVAARPTGDNLLKALREISLVTFQFAGLRHRAPSDLTRLQRTLLGLLGVPEDAYARLATS